jgi:hypothetical protein
MKEQDDLEQLLSSFDQESLRIIRQAFDRAMDDIILLEGRGEPFPALFCRHLAATSLVPEGQKSHLVACLSDLRTADVQRERQSILRTAELS